MSSTPTIETNRARSTEHARCSAVAPLDRRAVQCQLPTGHCGAHRHALHGVITSWRIPEPTDEQLALLELAYMGITAVQP